MSRLSRAASVFVLVAYPALANAQGRQPDEPRVSLYAGAGESTLFRGDLEFTHALGGEIGLRVPLSSRVHWDVSVGQFRRGTSLVALDVPLSSPTTLLGRADRLDQRTDRKATTADAVLVASGNAGRVGIGAGGGVGLMVLGRVFRQTLTGCSPGAESFCSGQTRTDFTSSTATILGLGTVDVRLTPRIALYGAGRFTLVLRDVASSGLRVTGGARISL